jgi:hypothetical protein
MSEADKAALTAVEQKLIAAHKAEMEKAAKHAKEWYQVMPGLEVKIIQRAA